MRSHVHLVAAPESKDGSAKAVGEAHRRYTRHVNFREGWRGHLWQGRFKSYAMDESYLLSAVRYIELSPVRAKMVREPASYPWSSAAAHVEGQEDGQVVASPLPEVVGDWREFLSSRMGADDAEILVSMSEPAYPSGVMIS
jgi:putative transposase